MHERRGRLSTLMCTTGNANEHVAILLGGRTAETAIASNRERTATLASRSEGSSSRTSAAGGVECEVSYLVGLW